MTRPAQLHSDWTLWFGKKRKPSKQAPEGAKEEPYEASLLELARVASLEQFWSVFRWLKPIRGLARDSSFFVFRGAAQPLWEVCCDRAVYTCCADGR